ncbi:MAG: hypothetical protein WC683_19255 [bacterium]
MAKETVRVQGLRELIRACDASEKSVKKALRTKLRSAAEPVRRKAESLFSRYSTRTASRFGISVRRSGSVSVEQRLRKVTGLRPDWGSLQMREGLVPALDAEQAEVIRVFERILDEAMQDGGFH